MCVFESDYIIFSLIYWYINDCFEIFCSSMYSSDTLHKREEIVLKNKSSNNVSIVFSSLNILYA